MLSLMRRSANSWLIGILFAIIMFVFALNFGPWAGNVGDGQTYAADVNGRVITLPEFQVAYTQQIKMLQSYRPEFSESEAEKEGFKKIVLEQLIAKELLANLAKSNGLSVTDAELANFIKNYLFGPNNAFNRETYRRIVYGNFNSTEAQFEAQVRRELLAERMTSLLRTGALVSDAEVLDAFETRSSQVSLDFIKVNPEGVKVSSKMDKKQADAWAKDHPEEISHYYNQHLSSFRKTSANKSDQPTYKEMDEVQGEIAKLIQKEQMQKEGADKLAGELLGKLKANPSFAKLNIANQKDSKAINRGATGLFRKDARFVPKIGLSDEVIASAFNLSAKKPVADKVFAINDSFYIIKLKEQERPDMDKFKTEKKNLRAGLLMMRQRDLMRNYIDYLKKQASIKYNSQIVGPAAT